VDAAVSEQAGRQGNRFLQKPFRMAELHTLLNEVISPMTALQPQNSFLQDN